MNFSSLYNYNEHLVFEYITSELTEKYSGRDEEFFLDVACYALASLPARYIRHEIDMAYYVTADERAKMSKKVKAAVVKAAKVIDKRKSDDNS